MFKNRLAENKRDIIKRIIIALMKKEKTYEEVGRIYSDWKNKHLKS